MNSPAIPKRWGTAPGSRFLFVVVVWVLGAGRAGAVAPTVEERETASRFTTERLLSECPADLPFAFRYGGRPSQQLLGEWHRAATAEKLDPNRTRHTVEYADPESGLRLRCEAVEYHDFPTVEWTLHFHNEGADETPLLEDVAALDAAWQRRGDEPFLLHHATGSPASRSDYAPHTTPLPPAASQRFAGAGGRPTNAHWSYFNLQWDDQGVIVVVGWPGQWAADFACDALRGVRVVAGQEAVRTKLLPGEQFRSPLMVLQFWHGDYLRSQNLWRRWMMAHSMPRPGGELPPPQFVAASSRAYEEMIGANEQNQIMHIDRYLEEGLMLDYWWMDAGWYIQQHGWPQVGTWEIDPERFPRGFRPISDHAHARGVQILVWFEPERVMPGTWLYEHRPEWLLSPGTVQDHPLAGMRSWHSSGLGGSDPCVTHNPTDQTRSMADIRWEPGRLASHPGPRGEYSVVRWQAAESGPHQIEARFLALDEQTTTDVHLLHNGQSVWEGRIRLEGHGPQAAFTEQLTVEKRDTIDFVVGWGDGSHISDTTGLEIQVTEPSGRIYDAAEEFQPHENPNGPWSYGYLPPGAVPDSSAFQLYDRPARPGEEGPRLLDLGNPDARRWLTDHISGFLTEQGIDLYRQDFNIDPLPFWRAADASDRQGMTENQYVRGYLAYWDELLRRHPGMLIDSCASGGRRNDLETMRRAVPLWRSDYAYEPIGHQCMTYGISLWLPYHGTGTVASAAAPYYGGGWTAVEPYAFWSNAAPSLGSGIDIRERQIDYETLRRLYRQWRQISRYYYADYYPLTPYSQDADAWMAWQFNDPEEGSGVVQAFRRHESPEAQMRFALYGLDPDATYAIEAIDGSGTTHVAGSELMREGLAVALEESPAAAVICYRRIP